LPGATFTTSSLGGIGGRYFTPIINAPEVAILGICRSTIEPMWDGKAFQSRLALPLIGYSPKLFKLRKLPVQWCVERGFFHSLRVFLTFRLSFRLGLLQASALPYCVTAIYPIRQQMSIKNK
jgi:hypothetical protein